MTIWQTVQRCIAHTLNKGAVAEWVRASTGDRTIDGSTPTARDFEFGTLAIPLTLLCQCLSDETLKAVGPLILSGVYARGSKISHQSALECVTRGLHLPL